MIIVIEKGVIMKTRILITCAAFILFASKAVMSAEEARYRVLDTEAAAGQENLQIPIAASFPQAVQGFSMALRHNCPACSIVDATAENTIAFQADYVQCLADNDAGTVVIGLLMEMTPPYSGTSIPALRDMQTILFLNARIDPGARREDYLFSFEPAGIATGTATITNAYTASYASHLVTSLHSGVLSITNRPPGGIPRFMRGDANQDMSIDVTDAAAILSHLFRYAETGPPPCIDACDVNDSGLLDISDPLALLSYLFANGAEPPLPGAEPGIDWTPDKLGCENPSAGYETDFWPTSSSGSSKS